MPRLAGTLLVLALALPADAETARQILDRRKQLDETTQHWDDRYERMQMEIVDATGGTRSRELELFQKRYPDDLEKAIAFFHAPAEVDGTAFLSFTHEGKPAEQWLYLPTYRRVRKITAATRNQRFVGSDLTYHDLDVLAEMPSWTESDAAAKLLREEDNGGVRCHVIELSPKRDDVAYKRIVLWLGRDDLMPRQHELYEEGGQGWLGGWTGGGASSVPRKRIVQSDLRTHGAIPVAHAIQVETPAEGTKTRIEITKVEFNQNLPDDLFTHRSLERGRR